MKIAYIHHSCFSVEFDDIIFLFDYYKGQLPKFDPKKHLYVFSSHSHHDHFDKKIFELAKNYPLITFILSSDIKTREKEISSLRAKVKDRIIFMNPNEEKFLLLGTEVTDGTVDKTNNQILNVKTLESTDEGVAFLISYKNKVVYHSGDLHWWTWQGETDEEYNTMTTRFFNEVVKLKGITLDVAFLPLDPRQEDRYWWGFDHYMNTCDIKNAFPMHFWMDHTIIQKFKNSKEAINYSHKIFDIIEEGQIFSIKE